MQTLSTIILVAQLSIFTAFVVNFVKLVHALITNK